MSDFSTSYAEVGYKNLLVSPEGMRVNKIDITRVLKADSRDLALPTIGEVDEQFLAWLQSDPMYKKDEKYNLIPMGMNVGSFDMQFVHYWLPKSGALFGYRSIDLNSPTFIEAWQDEDRDFASVKKAAKQLGHSFAMNHLGEKKEHHALYDAWMNVGYLSYFVDPDKLQRVGRVEWEGGKPA